MSSSALVDSIPLPSLCTWLPLTPFTHLPLQSDEVEQPPVLPAAPAGAPAISMQMASFAHETMEPPVLRSISLELPSGQLLAVVGQVGAGKSSLLAALLGEMHARGGAVKVGCFGLAW